MKKKYSKPEIVFDSFELSQSIAAGCEVISHLSPGSCAIYDKPTSLSIFTESMDACDDTPADSGLYNGLCYDVPTPNYNVFSS